LAPDSAVFKVPFDQTRWTGPARVFNGEADMVKAVAQGDIKPGDIVIIRYVGPKGAPGMPEMLEPSSAISSVPELNGQVVLITDARYSGVSGGAIGGHVCPEAFEPGSPISLVENGDPIVLDLQAGLLNLDVAPEILEKRKLSVVPPPIHRHCPQFSAPIEKALVRLESVVQSSKRVRRVSQALTSLFIRFHESLGYDPSASLASSQVNDTRLRGRTAVMLPCLF
jgi:dihydroxyacid dehydratase/phosphogluconate dehydratase